MECFDPDQVAIRSAHFIGGRYVEGDGDVIDVSVKRVTHIVSDIAAASAKQASGIDQISLSIGQIEGVTQKNAMLVEEAGSASESLRDQAMCLSRLITVFKLGELPQLTRDGQQLLLSGEEFF